jgi:hypothetical protein
MLHLAGKASIRRRPVNSALGLTPTRSRSASAREDPVFAGAVDCHSARTPNTLTVRVAKIHPLPTATHLAVTNTIDRHPPEMPVRAVSQHVHSVRSCVWPGSNCRVRRSVRLFGRTNHFNLTANCSATAAALLRDRLLQRLHSGEKCTDFFTKRKLIHDASRSPVEGRRC